jgi:hypothetical protein
MAENAVIFRDNQETQAADFNNMQDYLGGSLDHVVNDAIEPQMSYYGFTVSKVAPTQINVSAGRLYNAGQVYARNDVVTIDLFNSLPVTQKKQIAVVCWGSTITQDIQPRDFIIDADTGQSQPQSVAMTTTRYCNVDVVPGVEGPSPQYPAIDATDLLIAYVLVDPTGIVSVQQVTVNAIDNLRDLTDRVSSIEVFDAQIAGQVSTLTTALAALADQLRNYVLLADYQKLVTLVKEIWDLIHQPAAYMFYGTDNFLDNSQSFLTGNVDGAYNASVREGLRFPGSNTSSTTTLQLLNPSDPGATISLDGFMLPTPSGARVRLDCSFNSLPWIEERILQYIFNGSFTIRHLRIARLRRRFGFPFLPSPLAQVLWYQAQLDPTLGILAFTGESWAVTTLRDVAQHPEGSPDYPQHKFDRLRFYWLDRVDVYHWAKIVDLYPQSGQHICQTFLNAQDGWLSGVTIYMMSPLAQPLAVLIAGTLDDGTPDHLHQTIRQVALDGPGVQACFDNPVLIGDLESVTSRTNRTGTVTRVTIKTGPPIYVYPCRITFPPVFLESGKRYGLHFLSAFDHRFCISDQWDLFAVHQGVYWVSGNTGLYRWPSTTNPKSLRFMLHYATWGQWQGNNQGAGGTVVAEVQMQPLQLAGGIGGIDILAEAVEPPATSLSYQVQVAGVWQKFDADPNASVTFTGGPPMMPFKVVFMGTTDLMPGVALQSRSQVILHGIRSNTYHHISTFIPVASAITHVKVICKLYQFVTAHHTCTASLHYLTTVHKSADVVADVTLDDGSVERTWTFNTASIPDGFYIEIDGTTDGTGDDFVVGQRIAYASP